MVSSFTSRPISSVREQQQASPRLSSTFTTPHLRSKPSIADASPRLPTILGPPGDRSVSAPRADDRHSSPCAASTRSSETSYDRSSESSFGHRSVATAATYTTPPDADAPKPYHRHSPLSAHPRLAPAMNQSERPELGVRRASPPPSLRRPASPAGRISNHSAEWDVQSDRGSPRVTGRRPGPPLAPPSAAPGATAAAAAHSAFTRDYASSPRTSYRESAYRDPHARELSPPSTSGLKRKVSISSDMGSRRAMPDRTDGNGNAWAAADYPSRSGYPDAAYYRARERAESPERAYSSAYLREPAYPRYADQRVVDDPRYSPRNAHPTSPSTYRTAYHRGYEATTAPPPPPPSSSGHSYPVARRSDRWSPGPSPRSPPYAPRQPPPVAQMTSSHDAYSRSVPHSSYARRQSPPAFASDPRPQLPPLSSRTPTSRYAAPPRGRFTPPLEAVAADRFSPTPEPHAYSEPFYPDRRLYFARERIQDPEMDEYYHGPIGSTGTKGRYADYPYDPYGSPHPTSYPPPGAPLGKAANGGGPLPVPAAGMAPMSGHPGVRHHDPRGPYTASPYGPGDYMPHEPHEMHPHAGMARPGGIGRPGMALPATHVPPGPSAGIAPPPRRRGKLPKPVTDLLKSWLLEHASHPYPTEDEKRSLCSMTGLTLSQVSNWFINARRRILLPTGANGSPGGSTAAQVKAAFSNDSPSPPAHEV